MKKTALVIVGVFILTLLLSGFSYQLGKKQTPIPETTTLEKSKVISSRWADVRGKVTEIQDRTITLALEGDSLAISIIEGTKFVRAAKFEDEQKEIEFKDIKVGDELIINMEILAENKFEGRDVLVLSSISE